MRAWINAHARHIRWAIILYAVLFGGFIAVLGASWVYLYVSERAVNASIKEDVKEYQHVHGRSEYSDLLDMQLDEGWLDFFVGHMHPPEILLGIAEQIELQLVGWLFLIGGIMMWRRKRWGENLVGIAAGVHALFLPIFAYVASTISYPPDGDMTLRFHGAPVWGYEITWTIWYALLSWVAFTLADKQPAR